MLLNPPVAGAGLRERVTAWAVSPCGQDTAQVCVPSWTMSGAGVGWQVEGEGEGLTLSELPWTWSCLGRE